MNAASPHRHLFFTRIGDGEGGEKLGAAIVLPRSSKLITPSSSLTQGDLHLILLSCKDGYMVVGTNLEVIYGGGPITIDAAINDLQARHA